jgi:hypothetical protein
MKENGARVRLLILYRSLVPELDRMRDSIMKSCPHNDFINESAAIFG